MAACSPSSKGDSPMKTLIVLAALSATPSEPHYTPKSEAFATVSCFKSGEQLSGMNKICYYDCLGSQVAINIGSTEICPLTINH